MATRGLDLRILAKLTEDVGATPETAIDRSFLLSGFVVSERRDITLAAAADDVLYEFGEAAAVVIFTRDNRFSWRLADAETLVANVALTVIETDRATRGTGLTEILLTGNGSTEAHLTMLVIEKVAA